MAKWKKDVEGKSYMYGDKYEAAPVGRSKFDLYARGFSSSRCQMWDKIAQRKSLWALTCIVELIEHG